MFVQAREGEPFEELYRRKQGFIPAHEERRDKIRGAKRKITRTLAKTGGRAR